MCASLQQCPYCRVFLVVVLAPAWGPAPGRIVAGTSAWVMGDAQWVALRRDLVALPDRITVDGKRCGTECLRNHCSQCTSLRGLCVC